MLKKYMNRYNEVMKGKNGEKAKENLVTFNIIVCLYILCIYTVNKNISSLNRNVIAYLNNIIIR